MPQITINLTNNSPASLLTLSDFQPNTIYNILVENGTLDFFPATRFLKGFDQFFFSYVDVFQGTTGLYWDNYLGRYKKLELDVELILLKKIPFLRRNQYDAKAEPIEIGSVSVLH